MLYLVTLLISVGYWMFDSFKKKPAVGVRGSGNNSGGGGARYSNGPSSESPTSGGKYGAVVASDSF
jgi:hypothetical protein